MRRIARGTAIVVLLLAAAWLGLWWYTQSWLQDMLTNAAKMQTTSDGTSTVAYDGISRGGNPFVAAATVHNLRWSTDGANDGIPLAVGMAQVKLWIDLFDPLVMHVGLPDRIMVTTPRVTGSVTFGKIAMTTRIDPRALWNRKLYPLTGQDVAIENMDIVAGNTNLSLVHVDRITGHETLNPDAGPGQISIFAQDDIDGIALPPTVVLLGHVPFGGRITHIGFNMALSGPLDWSQEMAQLREGSLTEQQREQQLMQAAHRWAAHGGHGQARFSLAVGPSTLDAGGTLAFDTAAQPEGTAQITADHLDAFTAALTNAYPELQSSISTAETALSPYLSVTADGGQVLKMDVTYGKNGVAVNGVRKADMPPIDWTALETTPAPVPQAPGDGSGAAAP